MRLRNEEFLNWFSSSYTQTEGQLYLRQDERDEGTLQWAVDMPEFQTWRLSESAGDRKLWIRGPLGLGKSVMSGYFIELLKKQYPTSIVAYFFCRSKLPGLEKAADIIRTLSYQCMEDEGARSALEDLKLRNIKIDNNLPIRYLAEKMLLEPLRGTQKDVFIVLDGMDEADLEKREEGSGISAQSEVVVLLKCLGRLPAVRLLVVSRPNLDISNIIPDIRIKQIGVADNEKDIITYVNKFMIDHPILETFFRNEGIVPINYFQNNANGIFLWVVLALQHLTLSVHQLAFRQRLGGFSEASGSMGKLYAAILSKIGPEKRVWVREIIRWVVVAQHQLPISTLKAVVEYDQPCPLPDFAKFLSVECGAFLHLIERGNNSDDPLVQPIHETFRSFVSNPECCPSDFIIDVPLSHGLVTLNCLKDLESRAPKFTSLYGGLAWTTHLSKATCVEQSPDLMQALSRFVNINNIQIWIKRNLLFKATASRALGGWNIQIEEPYLHKIKEWIEQSSEAPTGETLMETEVRKSLTWDVVADAFGKASTALWLDEDLDCTRLAICFLLALKYYFRRKISADRLSDINDLTSTGFQGILTWAGCKIQEANKRSLGMAFFTLQKWGSCIHYLEDVDFLPSDTPRYLGHALMANREYERAVSVFKIAAQTTPTTECWIRPGLFEAYEAIDDYDAAIQYCSDGGGDNHSMCLGYAMIENRDYDSAIETLKRLRDSTNNLNIRRWWITLGLNEAYMLKGAYNDAIAHFSTSVSDIDYAWCLPILYLKNGDYDGVINLLEAPIHSGINRQVVFFLALLAKGDYNSVIEQFEVHDGRHDFNPRCMRASLLIMFTEIYKAKGVIHRALRVFEEGKALGRPEDWCWCLSELYKAHGTPEKAVEVFESFLVEGGSSNPPSMSLLLHSVVDALQLRNKYDPAIRFVHMYIQHSTDKKYDVTLLSAVLRLCKARGEYDQAIMVCEAAVMARPLETRGWHFLAQSYKAKGDIDTAILTLQNAIKQISIDYSFHKHLGDLHILTANYEEAIKEYHLFLDNAPSKVGLISYLNTEFRLPWETFWKPRIEIDHDTTHHFVWSRLAKAYHATSNDQAALKLYDTAIRGYQKILDRDSPNKLLWQYAEPQVTYGQYDVFHEKSSLPRAVVWFALGKVYECKGEISNALSSFQKALELDIANSWLRKVIHTINFKDDFRMEDSSDVLDAGPVKEQLENLRLQVQWIIETLPIVSMRQMDVFDSVHSPLSL